MAQLNKKSIVSILIIVLATVSSVSSQCCDFYGYPCTWDSTTWRSSNGYPPNLSPYTYFTSTEPDPYYYYIQNQPGSTTSTTTFYVPSDGTVISFDYFFDSPYPDPNNYFYVEFYNAAGSYSTWLLTVNTPSTTWQRAQIICNYQNNYCCGSIDKLPCSGTIRIVANIDTTYEQALFAVDNIGTTCSSNPTAPPPTPNCCSFDTDTCGSYGAWEWSEIYPSPYIPATSGYYEWTVANGAPWTSGIQYSVYSNTLFTLQYFIQSVNAHLSVTFRDYYTGATTPIATLGYGGSVWNTYNFYCTYCCGAYASCTGQLIITPFIPDGSEVAIDNVGRDNSCYGTYTCCLFDDPTLCGATAIPDNGLVWQFSGTTPPFSTFIPPSGSYFVYFETNYSPYTFNAQLRSSQYVTISYDTIFQGNIFIYNPSYPGYGSLNINFYNTGTGYTTSLGSITTTSSVWQVFTFYCNGLNCCQGASTCTGYIDFVALVNVAGLELVYAVDAFEIAGSCGTFPGSKNSTEIQFQPKIA